MNGPLVPSTLVLHPLPGGPGIWLSNWPSGASQYAVSTTCPLFGHVIVIVSPGVYVEVGTFVVVIPFVGLTVAVSEIPGVALEVGVGVA